MSTHETPQHAPKLEYYIAGFGVSLLLTFIAFGLALWHINLDHKIFSHDFLVKAIIALAILQLYGQAVFFLHLSRSERDRFNLLTFILTIFMVLFIAIGTLWIMNNLNQNMSMSQIDAYMHKEN